MSEPSPEWQIGSSHADQRASANWPHYSLRSIGPIIDGDWILNSDYSTDGVRLLQVGDIGVGKFLGKSARFVSLARADQLKCTFLEPGDVLISRMPDPIGRACIFPGLDYPCITAVDVSIWRPSADLADGRYLVYALSTQKWFQRVLALASGATRPRIPRSKLEELSIPLPPLSEQRRIVAILDRQMALANRITLAANERTKAINVLAQAYLNEAFLCPQAERWLTFTLGEKADIVSGITLGRKLDLEQTRLVPYLRVANVKDGYLDLKDLKSTPATSAEISALQLRTGDVLLTEGGDADKLGRGTYWRGEVSECIHQNHVFRVRLNDPECLPEFVSAQLCSAYGKRYFLAHAKQTTGIATINQRVIRNFPLKVPPLPEQQKIVAVLERKIALTDEIRRSVASVSRSIAVTPAAILRQVFGEAA